MIKAAQLAPSAHNAQDYRLIVIDRRKLRNSLAQAAGQLFIRSAPVVIAGVGSNPESTMGNGLPQQPIDIAIAFDHISLAAVEIGLASCWIGAFDQEKTKEILNVPDRSVVVVLMTIGYPADRSSVKQRKSINELVSYNKY